MSRVNVCPTLIVAVFAHGFDMPHEYRILVDPQCAKVQCNFKQVQYMYCLQVGQEGHRQPQRPHFSIES